MSSDVPIRLTVVTFVVAAQLTDLSSSRANRLMSSDVISSTLAPPSLQVQLASLMTSIGATAPNFVRCLKPNDMNVPDQVCGE